MIPDRFLDGVWYDSEFTAFVTFGWDDGSHEVIIRSEDGEPLARMDEVDFNGGDYHQIPSSVVNDPGSFLDDCLKKLQNGYYDPTFLEQIFIQYARQNVAYATWDPAKPPAGTLCLPTDDDVNYIRALLQYEFDRIEDDYLREISDDVMTYGSLLQELLGQLNAQRDD